MGWFICARKHDTAPPGKLVRRKSRLSVDELVDLGRNEEAEMKVSRHVQRTVSRLGENHPRVAEDYEKLGVILRKEGKIDEAEARFEEALRIRKNMSENRRDEHKIILSLKYLAQCEADKGKLDAAEEHMKQAYDDLVKLKGQEDAHTLSARSWLGDLKRRQGHNEEAVAIFEEVITRAEAEYFRYKTTKSDKLKELEIVLASTLNNLGGTLAFLGRESEALPIMKKANSLYTTRFGANHPHSKATAGWIAALEHQMQAHQNGEKLNVDRLRYLTDESDISEICLEIS